MAYSTAFSKRRKQIWEALHPEEIAVRQVVALQSDETEVESEVPPQFIGQLGGARPQTKGFAASTAEATGMTKQAINRAIARADALGDEALAKVVNTSLDSGVNQSAGATVSTTASTAPAGVSQPVAKQRLSLFV